jgi:DUF4097 and DUF4098 domain-containing protein YvlB
LFISVLVSASLCVSGQNNEPFATHNFSSIVASSIKSVEATTTNGGITVNGNAESEAIVEMYGSPSNSGNSSRRNNRRNNGSDENIKQTLEEEYTIEIKVEGGMLYAVARPKNQRGQQRLNVSFKISVPKQVDSNLNAVNGSVQLGNLSGSHNFRTVNGSLNVDNVSGNILGSTVNGAISVTNSNGRINLSTVNGGITISDVSGVISTSTVIGRVTERNVTRE